MKLNKTVQRLLANKMVLNIVIVVAVLNVIGYAMMGNFEAVTFFVLTGLLTTFFSKNMIIVLGIPLIVANLYAMRNNFREGLEDPEVPKDTKKKEEVPEDKESKPKEDFEVARKKGGSKIDYAATVEGAYDELNNILGGDGIKKLTADTQGLLEQQAQLTKAMGNIGPMIKTMKPMMESMSEMMASMK